MVLKQRAYSAQWKYELPVLEKMQVVEEIYRAFIRAWNKIPIILLYVKSGLHNIPVVFKIFPLLTCIKNGI